MTELPILITPDAELDIAEGLDRYRAVDDELEEAFRNALLETMKAIRQRPYSFQVIDKTLRRALLRKFPYFLIFAVFDNTVILFGCIHVRRNPADWQSRG